MKYTAAALAAAVAVAQAAPVDQVCKAVTTVVTGSPVWVPTPEATNWAVWTPSASSSTPAASTKTATATWSVWDPSSSKTPVASSTSSATWGSWDPSKTPVASSTSSATWGSWDPSKTPAASSTSSSTWGEWSTSSSASVAPTTTSTWSHSTPTETKSYSHSTGATTAAPTTTASPTWTPSNTPTASPTSTSTTSTPPAQSTCPAEKTSFQDSPSGSCGCEFTVYCNQGATPGQDTKFWERTSGETINSLTECQAICNDNSDCTAVIWTDSSSAGTQDYKRCWQTSGLPTPSTDSYGQLSYKGSCSGSCSSTYINA